MFAFKINNTYWSRLGLNHIIAIAILSSSLSKYCWCCWNNSLIIYSMFLHFVEIICSCLVSHISHISHISHPHMIIWFLQLAIYFSIHRDQTFFSHKKSDEISKAPPCLDPCRGYSRGRAIRGHRRYSQRGSLAGDPWSNPDSGRYSNGRSCRDYCNIYIYIISVIS